jgi:S1-C subfamily serine protease
VDPDDGLEEDGPLLPWLSPDDRLWRHPSEMAGFQSTPGTLTTTRGPDRRLWTVALLAGVVGAILASGAGAVVGQYHHTTTVIRPIEQIIDPSRPVLSVATNPRSSDVVDIAARMRPTIVELLVNSYGTDENGSGVIFRSDGYVLTNSHLVEGAQSVVAVMSDGHRTNCRLIGVDPATDIAVVKLQDNGQKPVALMGNSTTLRVGQPAVSIGSRMGLVGGPSVSSGIISALGLEVIPGHGPALLDMIQTDAAIDPGSSGGALVDANGMVVGITTAVAMGNQAMPSLGFATPIEVARDVANQLLTTGKVTHAWLGVMGADADAATVQGLGIPGGAVVQSVDRRSPAQKAGIAITDVITSFAGQPITSVGALEVDVRDHRPGDHVTVGYFHDEHLATADIVLLERPANISNP